MTKSGFEGCTIHNPGEPDFFFTIPREGKPKKKPQMNRKTGAVYTPKDTLNFEGLVREYWYRKYGSMPKHIQPHKGPIRMEILFINHRPKRLYRKKDPEGRLPCPQYPDWDNAGKALSDALNGVVYRDDKQIYDCHVVQVYGAKGEDPHIDVFIWED